MTKKEIIELYLADLNNLVPDSDAKRSRIIDLEDELEALSQHDVVGQSEQLKAYAEFLQTRPDFQKRSNKDLAIDYNDSL
jgi:hypothetical protein